MQKFSACRNCGSLIHFFSSTSTRCIMAIWPAGPPKLSRPIFAQTRKASLKPGRDGGVVSVMLVHPSGGRRPAMGFRQGACAPRIQGIVEDRKSVVYG